MTQQSDIAALEERIQKLEAQLAELRAAQQPPTISAEDFQTYLRVLQSLGSHHQWPCTTSQVWPCSTSQVWPCTTSQVWPCGAAPQTAAQAAETQTAQAPAPVWPCTAVWPCAAVWPCTAVWPCSAPPANPEGEAGERFGKLGS